MILNATIVTALCLVQLYQELDLTTVTFCEHRCLCSDLVKKCVTERLMPSCIELADAYRAERPTQWMESMRKIGFVLEQDEQEEVKSMIFIKPWMKLCASHVLSIINYVI